MGGARPRFLTRAAVLLLAALAAGCGYHLRGSVALPPALARPLVEGPEPLRGELEAALRAAGATPVRNPAQASAVVELRGHAAGRRTLSVSGGTARALEYELYETVTVAVRDAAGRTLLEPATVALARPYLYDRTQVLGTSDQETLIRQELRRDLVAQLMRRLEALGAAPAR